MVRRTSVDAYNAIKMNGLLSRLRFRVYEWLYFNGPATQRECAQALDDKTHSIPSRFIELARLGVIAEVGERACTFTGRVATAWDVTERLPKKPEPRTKTGPTIKELFAEVDALREKVRLYEIELARYRSEPAQKELFR